MPKTTSAGESSVWSWDDGTPLEFDDETGAPLPPAPPASEVPVEFEVKPVPVDTRTIDEPPADEPVPADESPAEPVPADEPTAQPVDEPLSPEFVHEHAAPDESSARPVDEPVDGPAPFTF